jgi:Protein of unknown function (DUF664)
MDDAFAKEYLHNDLRDVREVMLWKLDGLSEYDIRRPLTSTGTNLLGLVKHLSNTEARYFGDIFGRPFPERLPWWDDDAEFEVEMWVTRAEVVDRYRRASEHADAIIGNVPVGDGNRDVGKDVDPGGGAVGIDGERHQPGHPVHGEPARGRVTVDGAHRRPAGSCCYQSDPSIVAATDFHNFNIRSTPEDRIRVLGPQL